MKTSIKKLLSSLQFNILILLLIIILTGLTVLSSLATQQRVENIAAQTSLVKKSLILDRTDLKLSQIEAQGIARRLPILINKLDDSAFYEFINDLMIKESEQRKALIKTLLERADTVSKRMRDYFHSNTNVTEKRRKLSVAADQYLLALQPLTLLQAQVQIQYFKTVGIGIALAIFWSLIVLLLSKHASEVILTDVYRLTEQDHTARSDTKFRTTEMNRISLKLRSEGGDNIVSSKQDPVTQLPNYESIKSMIEKRPIKSKNLHISVCVFEIDNYTKLVNHYPQSVIDPILIKIASIMKLHKMQNDHIGRIDDSHFIAVLVRSEKKKAFDDCDHIRQMIEDNRFKLPHNSFPITVSGGFTIKTPSQTIDDAVKNAKTYLKVAQEQGGNIIAELKNTPKVL